MRPRLVALMLVLGACGTANIAEVGPLPEADVGAIATLLAESPQPVLLNVWASWCIPCRSEAPLLARAHAAFGDRVRFVGIDVKDTQRDARLFLAEFDLNIFEHYSDVTGAIPASLGARGVPLTFFFRPGGELSYLQRGVIDDRTLAVHLDELTR